MCMIIKIISQYSAIGLIKLNVYCEFLKVVNLCNKKKVNLARVTLELCVCVIQKTLTNYWISDLRGIFYFEKRWLG